MIATVNPIDKLLIGANYNYHFLERVSNDADGRFCERNVRVLVPFEIIDSTSELVFATIGLGLTLIMLKVATELLEPVGNHSDRGPQHHGWFDGQG